MNKMTVKDVDFAGKRVLMRVDFNVPLDRKTITDDTRIRAAIPTIQYILDKNPQSLVLMSHLGRPKGERNDSMSLAPVADALSHLMDISVTFIDDCVGDSVKEALIKMPEGSIAVLENTRFHVGETKNDSDFASQLAEHGEIFVNDAFGTAHRAHASNVGVSEKMTAVAGLLLEKEIDYLSKAIENPKRPFVAILGGAKVSDKITVIEALLGKVDKLLVGGGMANTFFKAQVIAMGDSLVEDESLDTAKSLLDKSGDKLVLPIDVVIADGFDNDANHRTVDISDGVPDGWQALDIGDKTIGLFATVLSDMQTAVWNGPMGVFEMSNFAKGTFAVAQLLAEATEHGATTIIGGGDSAAAAEQSGLADELSHISTGGGASLEMLEGQALPGLVALNDK